MTAPDYFWPLLGLALALALHALLVALGWVGPHPRDEELVERVDELMRTRRGATDDDHRRVLAVLAFLRST